MRRFADTFQLTRRDLVLSEQMQRWDRDLLNRSEEEVLQKLLSMRTQETENSEADVTSPLSRKSFSVKSPRESLHSSKSISLDLATNNARNMRIMDRYNAATGNAIASEANTSLPANAYYSLKSTNSKGSSNTV
jgi:hypothetical protein